MEDEERAGGASSVPPPSRTVSPIFGLEAAAFDALGAAGGALPEEDGDLRNDGFDDDVIDASDADDGDYGVAYNSDNDDLGGYSDGGGGDDW
jgi:hypothetical protein